MRSRQLQVRRMQLRRSNNHSLRVEASTSQSVHLLLLFSRGITNRFTHQRQQDREPHCNRNCQGNRIPSSDCLRRDVVRQRADFACDADILEMRLTLDLAIFCVRILVFLDAHVSVYRQRARKYREEHRHQHGSVPCHVEVFANEPVQQIDDQPNNQVRQNVDLAVISCSSASTGHFMY